MKSTKLMVGMVLFSFITIQVYGQDTDKTGRNWDQHFNRNRNFDTSVKILVQGKVLKVEKLKSNWRNSSAGIHLTVKNSKEEVTVHLGPAEYLDFNKFSINKGDAVKINTFKGSYQGKSAYFATDISSSNQNLVLRDEYGLPLWRFSLSGNSSDNSRWFRGGNGRGRGYTRGNYRGFNGRCGRGYNRGNRRWYNGGYGRGRGYYSGNNGNRQQ